MTKKALTLLLAATMAMSMLTACGDKKETQNGGNTIDTTDGLPAVDELDCKDTFVVSICGATLEDGINSTTEQPAEGWNTYSANHLKEVFPDIDVEFVAVPWDNASAKMQTILMSGETDLFTQGGAFQPEYYKEGLSQSLNPFLEADTEFVYEDHFAANWKTHANCTSYDGTQTLTLPWAVGYRIVMYDAEIFDQWGVEPLSENPTPEEVMEKAAQMTGPNPVTGKQNYGAYIALNSLNMSFMIPTCEYFGATECEGSWDDHAGLEWKMDSDEYAEAVQWVCDLTEYMPEAATTGAGAELWGTADNDIAIMIDSNGAKMTSAITKDPSTEEFYTSKFIPVMHWGNNGGNWTPCDGMGMSALTKGDDAIMAWYILKDLVTEGAMWNEEQWGPSFSPNLDVQATFPEWDIWRQMNARVIAEATHPGYEINPFYQATIQPTLASMFSRAAVGEDVDVKSELADLNRKAQEWSASQAE